MAQLHLQTIIFEVTQACDHKCLYCYNYWNHPEWQGGNLEFSEDLIPLLSRVLDQVDCGHITLTGGEPLLRKDLQKIVGFLHERGIAVTIISNGHQLTEDKASSLIRSGVGIFQIPLLSHKSEVHDQLSDSAGAFDAALSALANIRFHRGRAIVVFVATRLNIADIYQTLKLAFAFGARGVMLNRFNPGGRGTKYIEALMPTVEEMKKALQLAEEAVREFRIPISCSIPIQPCILDTSNYPHLRFGYCSAGTSSAYFTLDTAGNVRACNHTDIILGNVWETPFSDIAAQKPLIDFVAAAPESCIPCDWYEKCQGGCKASAQVCYDDIHAKEPFLLHALNSSGKNRCSC